MNTVNDSNFALEVEDASDSQIVVVNFSASWCGPCKSMRPKLELLESEIPTAKFVYCDVDDSPILTERFAIMAVPTYVVIYQRKTQGIFKGTTPEVIDGIRSSIDKLQ